MFVLFDTAAGYALFKVSDSAKVATVDDVLTTFSNPKSATEVLKLKGFCKFNDTAEALSAAAAVCDGTLDERLSSFLKETLLSKKKEGDKLRLAVVDKNLGGLIKSDLGIKCVYDDTVLELIRGIRQYFNELVAGLSSSESHSMRLGLSHSLARYKLKFSPDKVDTMIIQAIALLDELDKELNTYAMRVKEWYGWHFPEMVKVLNDNLLYAKTIRKVGYRSKMKATDLSDILPEELEAAVKEAAEVSMGTEISESDLQNIQELAEQVIKIAEYRASLFEYLKNRMNAIAPNLTVMVGELVGARLVAHAGSLLNLAKHPASTVQILGAEKALFRALKTKHDTPKYGLIYHASLVGQAPAKLKGKISRMLAAKTALSCRMDALGESDSATIGLEGRTKVESRLRQLEGGKSIAAAATPKKPAQDKYHKPTDTPKSYNTSADVSVSLSDTAKKDKKNKEKAKEKETSDDDMVVEDTSEKKKKKKEKRKAEEEAVAAPADEDDQSEKKKKKKEKKAKKAKKESEDSD